MCFREMAVLLLLIYFIHLVNNSKVRKKIILMHK